MRKAQFMCNAQFMRRKAQFIRDVGDCQRDVWVGSRVPKPSPRGEEMATRDLTRDGTAEMKRKRSVYGAA